MRKIDRPRFSARLPPSVASPISSRLAKALLVSLGLHFGLVLGIRLDEPSEKRVFPAAVALRAVIVAPRPMTPPASSPPSLAVPKPRAVIGNRVLSDEYSQRPRLVPLPTATLSPSPPAESVVEPLDGYDGDDLRQYKLTLAVQARRFWRYPTLARERRWQGTAEILVSLSAESPWPLVGLEKSSGHPALDEQALEMIQRASTGSAIPPGLQRRGARFVLPVQFSLDE